MTKVQPRNNISYIFTEWGRGMMAGAVSFYWFMPFDCLPRQALRINSPKAKRGGWAVADIG
jgi:hypothetical protein